MLVCVCGAAVTKREELQIGDLLLTRLNPPPLDGFEGHGSSWAGCDKAVWSVESGRPLPHCLVTMLNSLTYDVRPTYCLGLE